MAVRASKHYFLYSILFHFFLLILFTLSVHFSAPLFVVENTNQHDVISAVVLGDTAKSKILPKERSKEAVKPAPQQLSKKLAAVLPLEKDVIALKLAKKKKIALEKMLAAKKRRDLLAKELLAEIKKQNIKQKKLQTAFEKTLRVEAEKTMRQQLLDEDIKLQADAARLSQGIVNKYAALIKQAIESHWLLPPDINKKLSCELMIRLAPNGTVLDVQITRSSGDPALDRSARAAVMKASPLPVPTEHKAFLSFREFALKVKPENILANGQL